jgi:hypothetical protein
MWHYVDFSADVTLIQSLLDNEIKFKAHTDNNHRNNSLCALAAEIRVGIRKSGCQSSSAVWPKRRKQFYISEPCFCHISTSHPPQSRTRPLMG